MKFNPDGTFADAFEGPDTGFYGPRDVFAGPKNELYIVDQGRGRIAVFNLATGTFSRVWGERGAGEAQFAEPTGIAVTNELVFVTDLGNGRIQVFDLAGKFVRQWEIPTWKRESSETPDIVFDDVTKTVYVTSVKTGEILAFDIEGNPRQGFKPEGDEALADPTAMVIADANKKRWLYVQNTGSSTLAKFELEIPKKGK